MSGKNLKLDIQMLMSKKAEEEKRVINQKIVATECGIHPSVLSRLVNGNTAGISYQQLTSLMDYFDLSVDEIGDLFVSLSD